MSSKMIIFFAILAVLYDNCCSAENNITRTIPRLSDEMLNHGEQQLLPNGEPRVFFNKYPHTYPDNLVRVIAAYDAPGMTDAEIEQFRIQHSGVRTISNLKRTRTLILRCQTVEDAEKAILALEVN